MSKHLGVLRARLEQADTQVKEADAAAAELRFKVNMNPEERARLKNAHDRARSWGALFNDLVVEEARIVDEIDRAERKDAEEARQFWFRRFHTSLSIAHGAAFASIGAKLLDPGISSDVTSLGARALTAFGVGVVVAGAIPLVLAWKAERAATGMALVSAVLFVVGITLALSAFWLNAELVWPWQA